MLTSSKTKGVRIPTIVGTVANVKATLEKLQQNPDVALDKKEDSLLLRAHQLLSVVDLPLKVDAVDPFLDDGEEAEASGSPRDENISIARARAGFQLVSHSFASDSQLMAEAMECFANTNKASNFTESMVRLRDGLVSKIPHRLEHFKGTRLKGVSHLINHFSINAFEENILPLCEIAVSLNLVPKSVKSIAFGKSLLRPSGNYLYQKALDEGMSSLHGVALLHDKERGVFVQAAKVDGIDHSFGEESAKQLEESNSQKSTSRLHRCFPFRRRHDMQGEAKGAFSDLEMLVGVALDLRKPNDCLVREKGGLFFWSKRTMECLSNYNGSDTLQQRQMKLVMCMLTLFLNLMMDIDEEVSEGSFVEPFIGAFNFA